MMKLRLLLRFLTVGWILFLLLSCNNSDQKSIDIDIQDGIKSYLKDSLGRDSINNDLIFEKSIKMVYKINNDSIANRMNLFIAFELLINGKYAKFKSLNEQSYPVSSKYKDTMALAEYHWNYGTYHNQIEKLDSSYYHYYQAYNYYQLVDHKNYTAKMLYNMAFIQGKSKDYINSESKLFQAVILYNSLGKKKSASKCFNLLGSIYGELNDFDNSIKYHYKVVDVIANEKTQDFSLEKSYNDLGITYRKIGNYKKSISMFELALKNEEIFTKDKKLYAKLIDNQAYSKVLSNKDSNAARDSLLSALTIRNTLNDFSGIAVSNMHLSEYFGFEGDTIKSIEYGLKANKISEENKNNRDVLSSLIQLSKVDKVNSALYLNKHLELSNLLQNQQLKLRNKFARISFETDEYITKADKLSLQRIVILISSISLLIIISLVYFARIQKIRNKKLILERNQQKANEEIFNLLLDQQVKLEEGRVTERNRISEDLHDGILGKIFGARINLGFLEIKGTEIEKKQFDNLIDELQVIEKDIRDISHDLKSNTILESNYIKLLEGLIIDSSLVGQFKYSLDYDKGTEWNLVSNEIKINVYRILQELLQNIIKHSNATSIFVELTYIDNKLNLIVEDNGSGLELKKTIRGIGVNNIKSRIKKLGGNVAFNSTVNKGLKVSIKIPKK